MRAFRIVIDTREQKPFHFASCLTERRALKVGDYSVAGMEGRVAVERKSFHDFFHSFTKTRARMLARLDDLAALEASAVVVECTATRVMMGHPRTSVVGPSLLRSVLAMCATRGVLLLFCSGAHEANAVTEAFLRGFAQRPEDPNAGGVEWLERVSNPTRPGKTTRVRRAPRDPA